MVFVSYAPETKVAVVQFFLQGHSQSIICNMLGYSVSRQSLTRWLKLFEKPQCVIGDPNSYQAKGLSQQKIQSTLLSLQAIHNNLVTQMCITLKNADNLNIQKFLVAQFSWVERMKYIPAEFLVFTMPSCSLSINMWYPFSTINHTPKSLTMEYAACNQDFFFSCLSAIRHL
ncbi:uncharacterized protein VP01_3696g3 [Puccinia sorghi]|uniref:Transposase n=1 Tax=Puccinia sorghi TaxID=27349 RepID=A0A0L6UW57_9BASI|nr:uncharacterized protein VP01_3696g3 [Puccinia sorghi]